MFFRQICDSELAQYAYLIGCQKTTDAIVIDPERDIDRYVAIAKAEGLTITAVAETHIHADFLSGSREFADRHGVKVYVSDEGDTDWKYEWLQKGNYDVRLLKHGDTFRVGNIELQAIHTPGHTPEHLSYLVVDRGSGVEEPMGIASGDFVFVGDLGRPDLLESAAGLAGAMRPAAHTLYHSVHDFLHFPDYLQVWPGHGAGSACGKALGAIPGSTVGYERRFNPAIRTALKGEEAFVDSILSGQPEPPLYFARMKRLNKSGPAVLGALPSPAGLDANALGALAGREDVVVVDTRADRAEFMRGHLPRSLYAPLDKSFPTVVGSYVEPGTPIYLIIEPARLGDAVRQLVRIGLDEIVASSTPDILGEYADAGGDLETIETIDFARLQERATRPDVQVLDVRGRVEYEEGHLPGARHIAHTRLLVRHAEIEPGTPVAVHCATGRRAAVSASLLQRLDHEVVYVDDDFAAWRSRQTVGA